MQTYTAKNGNTQYKPGIKALRSAARSGSEGFCLACGKPAEGVEPDARRYKCADCGALKVYGAEELILMGLFHR